jgi:hypothetical protein
MFSTNFQFQTISALPRPEFDTALTETHPKTPTRTRRSHSLLLPTSPLGRLSPPPAPGSVMNCIKMCCDTSAAIVGYGKADANGKLDKQDPDPFIVPTGSCT